MLQIPDPLENKTIEKTLRTAAEMIDQLDKQKIKECYCTLPICLNCAMLDYGQSMMNL